MIIDSSQEVFPVISDSDTLIGLLSMAQLRKILLEGLAYQLIIVEDLMTPSFKLTEEMDLHFACEKFLRSGQLELPVLSEEKKVLGMISYQNIIKSYDQFTQQSNNS